MNFINMSETILENLGGADNINNITHCATRLRISYKNKNLVNEDKIKNADSVVGFVSKQGGIQVIIGPKVGEAYNDLMEVIKKASPTHNIESDNNSNIDTSDELNKDTLYYVNAFGNFCASVFMPMIPALIIGGLILSFRNLMINYFGISVEGGTAHIMLAIFQAAFAFLPIYIGFNAAKTLKLQPVLGALLGCLLVSPAISNVDGLSMFGFDIPKVNYASSVMPVIFGCLFMFGVDRVLSKIIPEAVTYFLKPLLTISITVPVTLIILGPIGTELSHGFSNGLLWLMHSAGAVAMVVLSVIYPYMVMLGLDKALAPVGINLIATLGYDPLTLTAGFVSNLSIGATAVAIALSVRKNKEKKGMITSFGFTALCGVTEPAFYGALISRPIVLVGTAIGAVCGGLTAGILGMVNYVQGGCPGLLTFLFFLNPDGSMYNLVVSFIVAIVTIISAFIATKLVLMKTQLTID
ncbi:PTS transporter subunit EIIC [Vibrio nitrifigilis]|uniref:PTS transporter subunit EIIC n=1 Tax=Vibrio nitrifigilis TaxID=2789781 RepID=A0ABS0GM46_9VIBR|nr:PTS transporter subunit EIIC [Vibrio nitrifigilis]MBF9003534.1 PTS transporter subunit EIIC [Vibrio nitrifigilis]